MPNLLTWEHYYKLLLLNDTNKINYYIKMRIEQNLSYRNLREKIKLDEYERLPESINEKIIKKKDF